MQSQSRIESEIILITKILSIFSAADNFCLKFYGKSIANTVIFFYNFILLYLL